MFGLRNLFTVIFLSSLQTFHTPSFGDEEFDIPELHHPAPQPQHHQIDQYHQMQNHQMGMMGEQQTVTAATAYGHQWHPTTDMMTNQTYQLQSQNSSSYHQMSSPNQQMLLMQPNTLQSGNEQHIQQHQTQLSPQMATGASAYIGQSPPQTAGSDENEDSDDNALGDAGVSFKVC
jgi:hypothetical protein